MSTTTPPPTDAKDVRAAIEFAETLPDDGLVRCEVWRHWMSGEAHEYSTQVSAKRFKALAQHTADQTAEIERLRDENRRLRRCVGELEDAHGRQ